MTDPNATEDVSARARRAVLASGLTQREVAQHLGMGPTALSKALHGTRRLHPAELEALAELSDIPLGYLTRGGRRVPAALRRAERDVVRRRVDPADAQVRRAQILEATARLIARRGFHNVTVAQIAQACGISTGTLHYHFSTKNDALREALFFYADRMHADLTREFTGVDSPVEKLRRLIDIQLPASEEDVDEWSIWIQSWNEALLQPDLRSTQKQVYSRWRAAVVSVLRECQEAGFAAGADVEALASRFTGLVDGLGIQVLAASSDMDVPRMRRLLLTAFEPYLSLH